MKATNAFFLMPLLLTGCHLQLLGRGYTSGLDPKAYARVGKVSAFYDRYTTVLRASVRGGGYDFSCEAPKAQVVLSFIGLHCYDMAGPDGPTQVWLTGVTEVGGKPVVKRLAISFDPTLPPFSKFNEQAALSNELAEVGRQPVDGRMARLARVLCEAYDDQTVTVHAIEVELPNNVRRRFEDQASIVDLLADLCGTHTDHDKGHKAGNLVVTVRYAETGNEKVLRERFGLEETVVRSDSHERGLDELARTLERGGSLRE
jgi:hypothetical protein